MKKHAFLAALFVAGLAASFAVAAPGKEHPRKGTTSGTTSTATTPTGTSSATEEKKVSLCHKTGSKKNPWIKVRVSKSAVKAHMRHGDIAVGPSGDCPRAPGAGGGGTTTGATGTTATTGATTTSERQHGKGKGKGKGKHGGDDSGS
jgi:hypothetical protein